jgi:hydrogenase maturation protein HypF
MPGGAMAVRKPYRMALGYLLGAERDRPIGAPTSRLDVAFDALAAPGGPATAFLERLEPREVSVVRVQLARGLNAPVATSAGRLFDAAASLLGLRDVAEFEAQAAIDLEMAAAPGAHRPLPYRLVRRDGLLVFDPRPTLAALVEAPAGGVPASTLAARFQETIATVTRELCAAARVATGLEVVCLSGGVFQNAWLSGTLLRRLTRDGFTVHVNQRVPVNDGGISYGQAAVAAATMAGTGGPAARHVGRELEG